MNRLKEFRLKAGLTQQGMGEEAGGWKQPRIYNYEEVRTPGLEDCRRLVKVLNDHGVECTIDDVFPPQNAVA